LDLLDKKIIRALHQNCRVSYQQLAKEYEVTLNAIKKRVLKLLDDGVISFCVEPSLAMVGAEWVIAFVKTSGEIAQERMVTLLGENQMVNEVGPLADGEYIIFANYVGSEGLRELTTQLKTLESVNEVEIHQVLMPKGKKRDLSKRELKIIQYLVQDPRMSIVKIADATGYSAKTIRKTLDDLIESEAIGFTVRFRPNAGDAVTFLVRIEWDESMTDLDSFLTWINTEFPNEFWSPLISASESLMIPIFIVNHVREISPILDTIKQAPFTVSAVSKMGRESYSFPDIRQLWLEKQFAVIGRG
jgi:DNA-binding Lrp family transcriptional regulator